MSEEILNYKIEQLVDRVEKLEEHESRCSQPEEGTLALMKTSLKEDIGKVESKLNWLITLILTTVLGALVTIFLSKMGFN